MEIRTITTTTATMSDDDVDVDVDDDDDDDDDVEGDMRLLRIVRVNETYVRTSLPSYNPR